MHYWMMFPFFRGTPMYASSPSLRNFFGRLLLSVYFNYSVSFTIVIVGIHIQRIYKKKPVAKVDPETEKLEVKDMSSSKINDKDIYNKEEGKYGDKAIDLPHIILPSTLSDVNKSFSNLSKLRSDFRPKGNRKHLGLSQAEGFENIFNSKSIMDLKENNE